MRQEQMSYGTDVLCRLFGRSRQAYYERSRYVAAAGVEEDTILSPVREVRKDFPRMGAGKLLIYLKPKLEAMLLQAGRDAFIELLYRNFLPVRKVKNRRKTTFSNHWMHKYPNLTAGYTPAAPNRLWVSDITYVETGGGGSLSVAYNRCIFPQDCRLEPVPDTAFTGVAGRTENGIGQSVRETAGTDPPFRPWQSVLLPGLCQHA
jgi:transposase InsO family protein